jgi:serine/threonine protein kinase
VIGTPQYMSPEQLRGEDACARSDQFAFCLTAWMLLAGGAPLSSEELVALASGVDVTPHHGDNLPQDVRAVLARGLAGDRDHRWPSMRALLDALTFAA